MDFEKYIVGFFLPIHHLHRTLYVESDWLVRTSNSFLYKMDYFFHAIHSLIDLAPFSAPKAVYSGGDESVHQSEVYKYLALTSLSKNQNHTDQKSSSSYRS